MKQFYTELFGPGILFSANIDSRFKPASSFGWGYRAGLGFTINETKTFDNQGNYIYSSKSILTLPLGVNYVLGKDDSPNAFEVGAGATIIFKKIDALNWYGNSRNGNFIGHASFMYRRQPANGGFAWRAGFTPIINTGGNIIPYFALSIGYAFR